MIAVSKKRRIFRQKTSPLPSMTVRGWMTYVVALLILLIMPFNELWAADSSVTEASAVTDGAANTILPVHKPQSEWFLGIASGYGQRSNPLIQSSPINLYFIVDVAWYGQRWFFDNGDLGYSLYDTEAFSVNWVTRFNSERLFFQKTDTNIVTLGGIDSPSLSEDGQNGDVVVADPAPPLNSDPAPEPSAPDNDDASLEQPLQVPSRRFAIESGFEWMADGHWGYAQASIFTDVSQTHQGYEVAASYGKRFHWGRWIYDASIGAAWKSTQLNDYYYGVLPNESSDVLPEYQAGSGLNTFGRFLVRYPLSRQWHLALLADIERLNSAVTQSPLVNATHVKSTYLGVKYFF